MPSLDSTGLVLTELGRYEEAVSAHRRALDIAAKSLRPDHPHVGAVLNNLGNLVAQGNPREALAFIERALVILEKSTGPASIAVASTLAHLGACYVVMKQPAQALPPLERALEIVLKRESADNSLLRAAAEFPLARALWESGPAPRKRPRGAWRPHFAGVPVTALVRLYWISSRFWRIWRCNMTGGPRLELVGSSLAFRLVVERLTRLAAVEATVLITGESGTGKELAARALHYLGPRAGRPFIPVNCGALPDSLVESELFGHERGAFTDARRSSAGVIGEADGGTLFLDEIDALSARAQGLLLRFLQDKSYRRVGGGELRADTRVVVASNADLDALVRARRFRHDLLYRLNVLNVAMPPLRERPGDALELARLFVARLAAHYGVPEKRLHPEAVELIERYRWPGNVRELENVIHREFLHSDGDELRCREARGVLAWDAPRTDGDRALPDRAATDLSFRDAKALAVSDFERRYIADLLARSGGNITQAARLAGKDRSAFRKLVRKYARAG